jgi:hypothetical protein
MWSTEILSNMYFLDSGYSLLKYSSGNLPLAPKKHLVPMVARSAFAISNLLKLPKNGCSVWFFGAAFWH